MIRDGTTSSGKPIAHSCTCEVCGETMLAEVLAEVQRLAAENASLREENAGLRAIDNSRARECMQLRERVAALEGALRTCRGETTSALVIVGNARHDLRAYSDRASITSLAHAGDFLDGVVKIANDALRGRP